MHGLFKITATREEEEEGYLSTTEEVYCSLHSSREKREISLLFVYCARMVVVIRHSPDAAIHTSCACFFCTMSLKDSLIFASINPTKFIFYKIVTSFPITTHVYRAILSLSLHASSQMTSGHTIWCHCWASMSLYAM